MTSYPDCPVCNARAWVIQSKLKPKGEQAQCANCATPAILVDGHAKVPDFAKRAKAKPEENAALTHAQRQDALKLRDQRAPNLMRPDSDMPWTRP